MEVTDELSFEGSNSLIVRDESTSHPIIVYSDPIEVTPGDTLHLKLQSTNTSGTVYAGIRTYTTPNAGIVNQALTNNWVQLSTGTGWIEHERESVPVPEEATIARVLVYTLVSGLGETIVDDIHLSVQEKIEIPFELTDLGTFVHDVTISRAGFYTEPSGREIAYAVMGGTPTYLLVIDVETEEVLKQIPIEDRINGVYYEGGYPRGMTVLPDGTVYIAGTPANLFKYTPGDDKVHYVLKFPGTAVFDLKNGPEGIIVGGSYRNNEIFEYNTVTEELTHLGRATEDQFYTYSVAYDPVRDDYYFGTGSTAHLIRYDRETGEKTEIALPERFSSAQWVWDMKVVEDKLFMDS